MDLSEKIRKLLLRSRSRSLTSLGREKISCMDLPLLGEEGTLCRDEALLARGGYLKLGGLGCLASRDSPQATPEAMRKTKSLERGLKPAGRMSARGPHTCQSMMIVARSRRNAFSRVVSLPDAGRLVGLTSALDEAMEQMMTIGHVGVQDTPDDDDDTDSDSEESNESEDDEFEDTAGGRLARDFSAAVARVMEVATGESTVEGLARAREGLWELRQAVQCTLDVVEGGWKEHMVEGGGQGRSREGLHGVT